MFSSSKTFTFGKAGLMSSPWGVIDMAEEDLAIAPDEVRAEFEEELDDYVRVWQAAIAAHLEALEQPE